MADPNEKTAPQQTAGAAPAPDSGVKAVLGDDIEIFPSQPLPLFDHGAVRAFAARSPRHGSLFALVCDRGIIPRHNNTNAYQAIKSQNILRLAEAGVVYWPPDKCERYVLIYHQPPDMRRFLEKPSSQISGPMNEEWLMRVLIRPVLTMLAEMRDGDFIHGGIHLANMYLQGAEGGENLVVGECLSMPMGYGQPALYLPIELALADPSGRGVLESRDDLYALGICVAIFARGINVGATMSAEEIIRGKVEYGAYGLVAGRERLPGAITEFLRGALNDDSQQRWNIDDALKWLEGRRLSPKQSRSVIKAARAFQLGEDKYWTLRELAMGVIKHAREAASEMTGVSAMQWLKRNFDRKALLKNFEDVVEADQDAASPDRMLTRISVMFDPHAPLRYKGLSLMPEGFGTSLAEAVARNRDIQVYGEIISTQLFGYWYQMHDEIVADAGVMMSKFEKCRTFLTRRAPNHGIERVLYAMCRDAPCFSPAFRDHFVVTPAQLALALEKIASGPSRGRLQLDRHMMAFLSEREARVFDPHLGHFISNDAGQNKLGVLKVLASIQRAYKLPALPKLTEWMYAEFDETLKRFYDADLREKIRSQLGKIVKTGDLPRFLDVVDDPHTVREDTTGYAMAQREYKLLVLEKEGLSTGLSRGKTFGVARAQDYAFYFVFVLAAIFIVCYLVYFLSMAR